MIQIYFQLGFIGDNTMLQSNLDYSGFSRGPRVCRA